MTILYFIRKEKMKTPLFKLRLIYVFAIALLMFSCQDDNIVTPPDPEVPEIFELKLGSYKVIEFQSVDGFDGKSEIGEDNIEEYFGTRLESFVPVEITISNDSTTFVKRGALQENFRTKWENNDELFLYDDNTKAWSLLGKRTEDVFLLSVAFFYKKVSTSEIVNTILGQAYALENYDTLIMPGEKYSLIWLKIEATYQ